MKFDTGEDLLKFLQENIKTSYRERYAGVDISPQRGSARRELKFRTSNRGDLHDSILELLKFNGIRNYTHKLSSHTVEVIDIDNNLDKVRILIKPKAGREWRQQNYWNEKLENLSNWRQLKSNPDTRIEFEILKEINLKIHELGKCKPVKLYIDNRSYSDIIGFVPGPFGAKADFMGIDSNGTAVVFISHKDGVNSKDFQQYSGISSRAGGPIYDHPEVQNFRRDIAQKETSDFYSTAYHRQIQDEELKKKSVFGKDFGSGQTGPNNIDFFCQGRVRITPRGNQSLVLNFETKIVHRTQIQNLNSDKYKPTLGVRRGEAYRSIEYRNDKVSGVRGGVFSEGYIEGRNSEPI